jgi:hypothetical protein
MSVSRWIPRIGGCGPMWLAISIPVANWAARPGYSPGKARADPGWPGPRRAAPIAPSAPAAPSRAASAAARA